MNRRELLRAGCATAAWGGVVGLAGCVHGSGDGDSDGGDGDSDGGDGETDGGIGDSDGGTGDADGGDGDTDGDADGSDGGSDGADQSGGIDQLAIVETESEVLPDDSTAEVDRNYLVTTTIENQGEETTYLLDYNYDMTIYDSEGAEMDHLGIGQQTVDMSAQVGPGEHGGVGVVANLSKYEPEVADHEVEVNCAFVTSDDPVYCEGVRGNPEPTGWEDPEWSEGPDGTVVENAVNGLEITGWETDRQGRWFLMNLSIENTGDRTTSLHEYNYDFTLYDENGTELLPGSTGARGAPEVAPGEVAEHTLYARITKHYPDVASIDFTLNCEGFFEDETAEGVYCSGG